MIKASPLNGKKVLVVDDDMEIRRSMIFDLKRRGCIIFEAECGIDALAIAQKNSIDIIVSDVRMPNGDGVELLKKIREISPDIPIVFLATGFADLSEPEALRMGAFALLEKPFSRQKMLSLLEDSCSRFMAEKNR